MQGKSLFLQPSLGASNSAARSGMAPYGPAKSWVRDAQFRHADTASRSNVLRR